jgi:hypothetical protein
VAGIVNKKETQCYIELVWFKLNNLITPLRVNRETEIEGWRSGDGTLGYLTSISIRDGGWRGNDKPSRDLAGSSTGEIRDLVTLVPSRRGLAGPVPGR